MSKSPRGEARWDMSSYEMLTESARRTNCISRKNLVFCFKIAIVFALFLITVFLFQINKSESLIAAAVPETTTAEPLDPRYHVLNQLPRCKLDEDKNAPRVDVSSLVEDYQRCMKPIVRKWMNDSSAINEKWEETAVCDDVFRNVDITYMQNKDEQKWLVLPTCKEENIMVTMGIGHDTVGEEALSRTLPNTKFFGADPILHPNRELYSKIGKFYPFAIGAKPGTETFRVMEKLYFYEDQEVVSIPFTYFLSDILKLKRIDIAWIDIEGGELQFLDQLHKGELLDKKGVTICQFNMEIHAAIFPSLAIAYHDFIFRALEEKRWVFMRPIRTSSGGGGVHKMFALNVENKECVRKFLQ